MAGSFETRLGDAPEEGIKAPVVVATQTPITLSGTQLIEAVNVLAGDRVLVQAQDDDTENGLYNVGVGAWTRTVDWNAANDVVNGVLVVDASSPSTIYQAVFVGEWEADVTPVSFTAWDTTLIPLEETLTLSLGQTLVTFSVYPTNGAGFTINGVNVDEGRLLSGSGYLPVDNTSIRLLNSYPAGTTITLRRNDAQGTSFVPVVEEENVTLTGGQTIVDFVTFPTNGAGFTINGVGVDRGRLLEDTDYTVVSNSRILLTNSFPVGSVISLRRNDAAGASFTSLASEVNYDNTASNLTAVDLQAAVDELADKKFTVVTSVTPIQVVNRDRFSVDTVANVVPLLLPASPNIGDSFYVGDYSGNFSVNACQLQRNGSNIMGLAEDHNMNIDNLNLHWVYIDSTKGWMMVP